MGFKMALDAFSTSYLALSQHKLMGSVKLFADFFMAGIATND